MFSFFTTGSLTYYTLGMQLISAEEIKTEGKSPSQQMPVMPTAPNIFQTLPLFTECTHSYDFLVHLPAITL